MSVVWRIELLGGVRAIREGCVEDRFARKKAAELLGYLALNLGVKCPRTKVADALWPEVSDPERLQHNLRNVVHSLRHQLEPPGIEQGSILVGVRATLGLNE